MRDRRFVADHRGGTLSKENHQKLIRWAKRMTQLALNFSTKKAA